MFKRKIETTLLQWKAKEDRKPLVIKGCRQCGKTSSVLDFAKRNYANVVYLDFHEHKEYKAFFAGALDVDTLTLNISVGIQGARFVPHETCIVLDEIQDCPNARASLKFFKLDGRYDVICTGSLLGVNGYKTKEEQEEEESASIPVGFEQIVSMYPMDFEEWLWANGIEKMHIDYLRSCLQNEKPVNEAVHQRMQQLLLRYVVVGGMPEAVTTFFDSNNMNEVFDVQHGIIETYKADMLKYALLEDKPRIRECFESIPAQLAKENKKFQISKVASGARSREYEGCVEWLENAGMILRCSALAFPELPIRGNEDLSRYKLYFHDTGLLVACLEDEVQGDLRANRNLGVYKGALYENFVASALAAQDYPLCYYKRDVGSLEEDFFVRNADSLIPVEVKACSNRAKALKTLIGSDRYPDISFGIKFGNANVGFAGRVLTMPWFCAFRLRETLKEFDPGKAEADSSIDT